ncbi:MAG: hypothetical protein QW035_01285 [Candidatus Anstonellales archaeon]
MKDVSFYLLFGFCVLSFALAIALGSALFAAACAFFALLAVAVHNYGNVFFPKVTKSLGIAEKRGRYEMVPERDALVTSSKDGYIAYCFLKIWLYESAIDSEDKGLGMLRNFHRVVSSVNLPFSISMRVAPVDMSKMVDEIKERRSYAEAKLSKARDDFERRGLERECSMWDRMLERIAKGEKTVDVQMYASTHASGFSRDESLARARAYARELSTILGSALNAQVSIARDNELWELAGVAE